MADKENIRDLTEVPEEIRKEIEKEIREEIKEEIREEIREEIKEGIKEKREEIREKREEIKKKRSKAKEYFYSVFNITDNMMSYEEIDAMMREQTVIHGANMWILMLAILIASIGLNVNSTAVIIGAMLISPLMSGILAMGYSVAVRDLGLLKQAIVRFATQVMISLIASTLYFSLSPMTAPTAEMIARTSPTLWDVLIALFGGLAGMIGNTRTKHSNVIPGVAIATALMPPLCTAGYGIATGQMDFFLGAFYLFIINTLFIAISTAIITLILRVPYHRSISAKKQKRVNAVIIFIVIIVVMPSVFIGAKTVYDSYMNTSITSYLEHEFEFADTQIVKSEYDTDKKTISVSLVGSTVSDDVIKMLESRLSVYGLDGFTLRVTQNVFTTGEDDGDKIIIAVQENTISELNEEIEEHENTIASMQEEINEYEATMERYELIKSLPSKVEIIYPHLKNCHIGIMYDGKKDVVVLTANANEMPEEYEKQSIKSWLKAETGLSASEVLIILNEQENEAE